MNLLTYTMGLDLGQSQDFTALGVVERTWHEEPAERRYAVRALKRYPQGTPYPQIVDHVTALAAQPPLTAADLVVDATGVGRPVVDLFRRSAMPNPLVPVVITGGQQSSKAADGTWHVPKKELIDGLLVLFQTQQLRIARHLPEAATLVAELTQFQRQRTAAGNETFGSTGAGQHDDLVLAVALACWQAVQLTGWENWTPPVITDEKLPWALRAAQRHLWEP
jgi:hypothetical protein